MLTAITVQNFALIDQAELSFNSGFSAITGETGSGKSILLGAIGVLLGHRADSKFFRNSDLKCIIEGTFVLDLEEWKSFFEENDLDLDDNLTIRREILPNGKTRAFINDTPVSIQLLKSAGERLIDIHSQHGQSLIGQRHFQLSLLDKTAKNQDIVDRYQQQYHQWKNALNQIKEIKEKRANWESQSDYIRFQLEEFNRLQLENVQPVLLEQELEALEHADDIKQLANSVQELILGDQALYPQLQHKTQSLSKLSSTLPVLGEIQERLKGVLIELKDLAGELEHIAESVTHDPLKIQSIQSTLAEVYRLQQKHRVAHWDEMLALQKEWEVQLEKTIHVDDEIQHWEKQANEFHQQLKTSGELLTQRRREAALLLAQSMTQYMHSLGLEHATWSIALSEGDWTLEGKDQVKMLFTANKGSAPLAIQDIASGGEISRVMLAIKATLGEYLSMPTLILDEIDQGVSGEVAKKIGDLLQKMGNRTQLISITHLPQVASKAQHHYKVFKQIEGVKTTTNVLELDQDQRILEIAEMLSGKTPSVAAIANAKELLAH